MTFLLRLGSTLGLWIFVIATVFSGNEFAFLAAVFILAMLGLREFFHILAARNIPCFPGVGMSLGALYILAVFFSQRHPDLALGSEIQTAGLVVCLGCLFFRQMMKESIDSRSLDAIANTLFGFLYIPWLFSFLIKLIYLIPRDAEGHFVGQYYILFVVLVTKFSDMGAYVFGSLFGKHPFVPRISPKKTWEGVMGAMVTAFIGAYWLKILMPDILFLINFQMTTLLAFLLGSIAIFGDLSESIIKRSVQAKDSSDLVPGIGGTLDLIDSILFTAPVMYFVMHGILLLQ